MVDTVSAHEDPELRVSILRSSPLRYDNDPDPDTEGDRPPHVRAGSGIARVGEVLAVIQDDANFLALVDPRGHSARSVPLPAAPTGERVFGPDEGNVDHKLDLEACVAIPGTGGREMVAFGSGSSESREWVLRVAFHQGLDTPAMELNDPDAFYGLLRETSGFCGSRLNIEGAVFVDDRTLRLFNRGDADPERGEEPADATCDVDWPALVAHLEDPENRPPPRPERIVRYRLGELDGVRLTFSDAERVDGAVLFSASAEESSKTDRVTGSVLGVIDGRGARWARVHPPDRGEFRGKIEGLCLALDDPRRLYFVIDDDDASKPSEIFEALLEGPWF